MAKTKIDPQKVLLYTGVTAAGIGVLIFAFKKKKSPEELIMQEIEAAQKSTVPDPVTGKPMINLYDTAVSIAEALGTNGAWYDYVWNWNLWAEDENRAVITVLQVPNQYMKELESIYAAKYNRSLREDLQNLLTQEQWDTIKYKFY